MRKLRKLAVEQVEPSDAPSNLSHLLANDAIQNTLLQNYRLINIYVQTILLAVGAVLVSGSFGKCSNPMDLLLIVLLAILSGIVSLSLHNIVRKRAETVSHVHRRILLTEYQLPIEQRSLTLQKLFQ